MDIALISVIVTGSVALATVVFTPLLNLLVDSLKWGREAKASKVGKVDEATRDLLAAIAEYQTDIHLHGKRGLEEIYSNLLTHGYWWEHAIIPYCGTEELRKLAQIRDTLLDRAKIRGQQSVATVQEILAVAHSISGKVR